ANLDAALIDLQLPDMDGAVLVAALREFCRGRSVRLVALTYHGGSGAIPRDLFTAVLSKPVRQAGLLEALRAVFTEAPRLAVKPPAPTMFDPQLAERVPLRILLAEDAVINQKLMLAILGRLGYRADVASNGVEVLDAMRRQSYDLILMDVQMPE